MARNRHLQGLSRFPTNSYPHNQFDTKHCCWLDEDYWQDTYTIGFEDGCLANASTVPNVHFLFGLNIHGAT